MPGKSGSDKIIHKTAAQVLNPARRGTARYRAGKSVVETSSIAEMDIKAMSRVAATGPNPEVMRSPIRLAVVAALNRRGFSGYWLWKTARQHCQQLPAAAVYEFLRGERAIGLEYLDAILRALELELYPRRKSA